MGVEDRQQRQRNAGRGGGRRDPLGHLGDVGVGLSVAVVVQIVELANAAEAGFQHLDIELGGDRLDLFGRHRQREAVHHLAPAPETVGRRPARLGEPGHAALERVAVQVGHRRNDDRVALVTRLRAAIPASTPMMSALVDRDADVATPSRRQAALRQRRSSSSHLQTGLHCVSDMYIHNPSRLERKNHGRWGKASEPQARVWRNARLATLAPEQARPRHRRARRGRDPRRQDHLCRSGDTSCSAAATAGAEIVDCEGRWITPGLIDCHTHLVHAGNRANEFEMRLAGATYEEVARAGGGIVSSVKALRAASEDELVAAVAAAARRADRRGRHHDRDQVGLRPRSRE